MLIYVIRKMSTTLSFFQIDPTGFLSIFEFEFEIKNERHVTCLQIK